MKLVITWSDSDGCTYSCDITECVEYESEEQFLVDFDSWKEKNAGQSFMWGQGFAGTTIQPDTEFEVFELEEWFEKHKATPQQ